MCYNAKENLSYLFKIEIHPPISKIKNKEYVVQVTQRSTTAQTTLGSQSAEIQKCKRKFVQWVQHLRKDFFFHSVDLFLDFKSYEILVINLDINAVSFITIYGRLGFIWHLSINYVLIILIENIKNHQMDSSPVWNFLFFNI